MAKAKEKEPDIDLSRLRNIGIIAHIDAGKTTTTEHLLYFAGEKHKLGAVDSGNTETDYDEEEQSRGITIYSACVPLHWLDHTINLIDTPGHVDFTAEVERSLRVLDGAVCVFDGQKGVEAQSETVWRQADKYLVPRLVFINKMDKPGADFAASLESIRERLDGNPLPLFLPIGAGPESDSHDPFRGIVDLIEQKALYFNKDDFGKTFREESVPEEMVAEVARYRENLFDRLTEHDPEDRITTALLEGQEPDPQTIREVIRAQTLARRIQPTLCGSGREHIGIQPLMNAICWYLPSPTEVPPVEGYLPGKPDKIESRACDPSASFCGLVFKVISGTHGDLFYIRIYSGRLKGNMRPVIAGKNRKENIGKIFHVHADPDRGRVEVPEGIAGDIVATLGMKEAITGDTLCEASHQIVLERISFAQAVVAQSIEPQSSADKDKLLDVLSRLQREDPTFHYRNDEETGQMLMSGMGMLHLEVKKNRMERDFKLKVRVGQPRVSYRETLASPRTVEAEYHPPPGSPPNFGKVTVRFENEIIKVCSSVRVISKLKDGTIKPEFEEAALRSIESALQSGEFGYPTLNIQATLIDAEMNEEISNEVAFSAAGAYSVRKSFDENMKLLEPIMRLRVTVPEEFIGGVMGDLNARRGDIQRVEMSGKLQEIEATVPLSKMFDYADKVRSLTQGRANSSMEPSHYAEAPDDVVRTLRGDDF